MTPMIMDNDNDSDTYHTLTYAVVIKGPSSSGLSPPSPSPALHSSPFGNQGYNVNRAQFSGIIYLQHQNNEGMIASVFPCLGNVWGKNHQIGLPYHAGERKCVYWTRVCVCACVCVCECECT